MVCHRRLVTPGFDSRTTRPLGRSEKKRSAGHNLQRFLFHLAAEQRAMMAERPPSDSCEGGCFIAVGVVRLSTATLPVLPRRYYAVVTSTVNTAARGRRCLLQESHARPHWQDGCTHSCTTAVGEVKLPTTTLLPRRSYRRAAVTAFKVLNVAHWQARPQDGCTHGCTVTTAAAAVGEHLKSLG